MKNYVVTAQVEIEVMANSETEAISNAELDVGFDVQSFRCLSVECFDDEDESEDTSCN